MKIKSKQFNKRKNTLEDFKDLRNENWTIKYNRNSKRFELRNGDEFKISDISVDVCKRTAELYHKVSEEGWTKNG